MHAGHWLGRVHSASHRVPIRRMGKLKYPSKEQIALKFAADYAYPLEDQSKLERVAKYVAATDDIMAPKEALLSTTKPYYAELLSVAERTAPGFGRSSLSSLSHK